MQKQSHPPSESSELNTQLLQEESILKPEENAWLSEQFGRLPYKLYKYWLVLSMTISLLIICLSASTVWDSREYFSEMMSFYLQFNFMNWILQIIDFTLLIFGSGEMLYAIKKKKSKIAQRGILKLQYSTISSVTSFLVLTADYFFGENVEPFTTFLDGWISSGGFWMALPVINLIGGFAVLQVFKKNHPLAKCETSQTLVEEDMDLIEKDIQEQNKAIASKLSKYDEQLNTWAYFVFRWLLKFVIIFDSTRACFLIITIFISILQISLDELVLGLGLIVLSFSFSLSAWSALQTEVALTIKALEKLERGLFLLKVCIILSIIAYLIVGLDEEMYSPLLERITDNKAVLYFGGFLYCCLLPIFTVIGIPNAKKIMEERNKFAQVLTFDEETYL